MSEPEARDIDSELGTNVYTAPAERLRLIYLAFVAAGFNKRQAEAYVAELVGDEFRGI